MAHSQFQLLQKFIDQYKETKPRRKSQNNRHCYYSDFHNKIAEYWEKQAKKIPFLVFKILYYRLLILKHSVLCRRNYMDEDLVCPYCGEKQETHSPDEITSYCVYTECERCGRRFEYSVYVSRDYDSDKLEVKPMTIKELYEMAQRLNAEDKPLLIDTDNDYQDMYTLDANDVVLHFDKLCIRPFLGDK